MTNLSPRISKPERRPGCGIFLQRKCACGGKTSSSGSECADCRRKKLLGQQPPLVQPKLTVNQLGDRYEQEADRWAEEIMRLPAGQVTAQPSRIRLQRRESAPAMESDVKCRREAEASDVPDVIQDTVRSPGEPLDASTRGYMEARLGHNFGRVRVHADERAAASARAVHARAYAVGRDMVFGAGQFVPQTRAGLRLLAHELTHVVQAEGSPAANVIRRQKDSTSSFAGVEKIPERRLREHKPKAPEMRPADGETVEGVPVTRATCECEPSVAIEEDRIEKSMAAFRSCYRPGMLVDALYVCAKKKLYTPMVGAKEALDVPAAAETSSSTGEITLASGSDLEKRLKAYGHPEHCWHVIVRAGILKHEIQHVEDFDQIARSLGEAFFEEFIKLQGDPARIEKLRKKFPRETASYELKAINKFTIGATTALRFELNAFNREKEFFAKVRAAMGRVCTPHVPSMERPTPEHPEQPPLYQPRTSFEPEVIESEKEL